MHEEAEFVAPRQVVLHGGQNREDMESEDMLMFCDEYIDAFRYASSKIDIVNRNWAKVHTMWFLFPVEEEYDDVNIGLELHKQGPNDDCDDFKICKRPLMPIYTATFTHGSYSDQMKAFYTQWWSMSDVDLYIQWSMRYIGSYNGRLFVWPFEDKTTSVQAWYRDFDVWEDWKIGEWLWRTVHPPSYLRFKHNMRGHHRNAPSGDFLKSVDWAFDLFKCKAITFPCLYGGCHYAFMAAFNLKVIVHGRAEGEEAQEPFVASFDSMGGGTQRMIFQEIRCS